eukprot:TRINITY_DN491_c0_g1_i1.p2 TRINITY_DN491_c0_g1~~TRINITY_DN491_c0_g1_i1.p2  ORF type:complete len:104 (-),score=36.23 TRINITY_DN491_c0_g1_i1:30-317(-)
MAFLARSARHFSNSAAARGLAEQLEAKSAHAVEEMNTWRRLAGVGFVVTVGVGAYTIANLHDEFYRGNYEYLRIRNKPFPWGNDSLFERKEGGHH